MKLDKDVYESLLKYKRGADAQSKQEKSIEFYANELLRMKFRIGKYDTKTNRPIQ
jgi:hypothetical protein